MLFIIAINFESDNKLHIKLQERREMMKKLLTKEETEWDLLDVSKIVII